MNQKEFLRALDADIIEAFADVGMADAAQWTAQAGGAPRACTVLVDREAQFFGDDGEIAGRRVLITLFLVDVPAPAAGDTVAIGDETFVLDELAECDESKSRWVVVRG